MARRLIACPAIVSPVDRGCRRNAKEGNICGFMRMMNDDSMRSTSLSLALHEAALRALMASSDIWKGTPGFFEALRSYENTGRGLFAFQ